MHHRIVAEIRAELARRHQSQRELAAYLGITEGSTSRKLRSGFLSIAELSTICAFLELPISVLTERAERRCNF